MTTLSQDQLNRLANRFYKNELLQWEEDCLKWRGRVLTGDKVHWCFEWDGLPVDETTPEELECCNCFEGRGS